MAETDNQTPPGHDPARERAKPGHRSLLPENLVDFLRTLRHTGNVSLSARRIGWSRSTVYAFAQKNASFRESMREAMTEGRELLVGEGWKRATTWSEYTDTKNNLHIKPPSDRILSILIAGYFQEFKPGRGDEALGDLLIPETADLTLLEDHELADLERILVKAGVDELASPRQD